MVLMQSFTRRHFTNGRAKVRDTDLHDALMIPGHFKAMVRIFIALVHIFISPAILKLVTFESTLKPFIMIKPPKTCRVWW